MPTCLSNGELLAYVSSVVDSNNRQQLEDHVIDCCKCLDRLANYARIHASEETAEEARLIDSIYEQTLVTARNLVS